MITSWIPFHKITVAFSQLNQLDINKTSEFFGDIKSNDRLNNVVKLNGTSQDKKVLL